MIGNRRARNKLELQVPNDVVAMSCGKINKPQSILYFIIVLLIKELKLHWKFISPRIILVDNNWTKMINTNFKNVDFEL